MTDEQYIDRYVPQAKMLRLFIIINMLATGRASISKIAKAVDMTNRSAYRYLILLEELGFQVKRQGKGAHGLYFLGHDYYPPFISFFRDVWKLKFRNHQRKLQRQSLGKEAAYA